MNRTLPHVALSQHAHDRHGDLRRDEAWLDERWHEPDDPGPGHLRRAAATRRRLGRLGVLGRGAGGGLRLLLGERDGVEHFALLVDPAEAPGEREEWVPLRDVRDAPGRRHDRGRRRW